MHACVHACVRAYVYKHGRDEKHWLKSLPVVSYVKFLPHKIDRCVGDPASQPNTTVNIDPFVTHMDKNKNQTKKNSLARVHSGF